MACDLAWLAELDINPLLVDERGVLVLDARVRLRPVPANEGSRHAIRPYPSALEERVQVVGRELLLRPIRPEDGQRLMAFYAKASPADLHRARAAGVRWPDHGGRRASRVRPDNLQAEFAIQVASGWHGCAGILSTSEQPCPL